MGSFNGIWSDMVIENIIIKDFKSFSSIVGIIRKKFVFFWWVFIRYILVYFIFKLKEEFSIDINILYDYEENKFIVMLCDE